MAERKHQIPELTEAQKAWLASNPPADEAAITEEVKRAGYRGDALARIVQERMEGVYGEPAKRVNLPRNIFAEEKPQRLSKHRYSVGDLVTISASVVEVAEGGQHLVLLTDEPTNAYPEGTRINLEAHQVEPA